MRPKKWQVHLNSLNPLVRHLCQYNYTFVIISIDSCNINQTCMNVQECPYTKKVLEELAMTNDVKIKENLITSIRSLICGNVADKTICCDNNNGE